MTDEAITDPGRIFPTKQLMPGDQDKGGMPTPSQPFSSFMQKPPTPIGESSSISPFALMQGSTPVATTPSTDTMMAQLSKMQATSLDIRNQLATPNLKLKSSTKYLMRNKLSEANDNLRALNSKIGASIPAEPAQSAMVGPLGKFLAYMTHGQQMMDAAKAQLQQMKAKGTSMAPGDFLLVQLKMNKAQQLLEFSSVLLSNAVSDIKQFMQIQL